MYKDNLFSSPELFNNLTKKKTVKQEGHIREPKAHKSQTEISGRSSEDQGWLDCNTVDGQERCLHANIHDLPQEGNFLDEQGNVIKPENVEDYNRHMTYVDKGDRMANSYSISCRIWKWTKSRFPSVQSDYFEQLHPSFFMWWGENFTQRFLTPPFEEHARSGWTRMATEETCRETIHCFCEHR